MGATTLNITTFRIMTLTRNSSYVTLSITDTQHNNALLYAECHVLFIVMLNVVRLSVVAPVNGRVKQ